jgi:hypothetical protein
MSPVAYFPFIAKSEVVRIERFDGPDLTWDTWFEELKDGSYYHEGGRLVAHMVDNSATMIAYPGWRPLGDFQIDADIRFRDGEWQNGVGVVFGGNDDWSEYYVFLLAWNFDHPGWGFARAHDGKYTWLSRIEGAPATVHWFSEWNHITIVRTGSNIRIYCNGVKLPGADYEDSNYGTNRHVGVIATTYEIAKGKNEYDNFVLTPLSAPY